MFLICSLRNFLVRKMKDWEFQNKYHYANQVSGLRTDFFFCILKYDKKRDLLRNFQQRIERKPLCDLLHFVSWKKIVASTSNNNNLRVYDRFLGVGGIHRAP